MVTRKGETRASILETSVDMFGLRGVAAVSLDEIAAAVGVAKQTVLYWFPSKDELLDAVLLQTAGELANTIEGAIRDAPAAPLERIEAVIHAVFRTAVRRPALLGLMREVSRLAPERAERLGVSVQSYVRRASDYLAAEMALGRLRTANPGLVVALAYATVTGVATEPEALRAVDWTANVAGLRQLRREVVDFVIAALRPEASLWSP